MCLSAVDHLYYVCTQYCAVCSVYYSLCLGYRTVPAALCLCRSEEAGLPPLTTHSQLTTSPHLRLLSSVPCSRLPPGLIPLETVTLTQIPILTTYRLPAAPTPPPWPQRQAAVPRTRAALRTPKLWYVEVESPFRILHSLTEPSPRLRIAR